MARAALFEFGEEFQDYLRENGVPKALKTYTTWLNRATRRLSQQITPKMVGNQSQVEPLIDRIKALDRYQPAGLLLKVGTPDENHLRSVLRKYAAMVQSNYRGLFDNIPPEAAPVANDARLDELPKRVRTEIYRVLRDTKSAREIKRLYEFRCQLCETRLEREPGLFYAEAHHLQPLGKPHNGYDVKENLICVCPNCHVLLDYNALKIAPEILKMSKHSLGRNYIDHHNRRCR
jgi:hypothetical protein